MWLLNTDTVRLEEFFESQVPRYAILSHTWEAGQEVSFQDMKAPQPPTHLSGYHKIKHTCVLAATEGIRHAWVDTCCIDKSSSAELTESINSMYRWYQESAVCYVYLSDLVSEEHAMDEDHGFSSCRWFTRGWTLQELIAPRNVIFFDASWACLGNLAQFMNVVCRITKIEQDVLSHRLRLEQISVAERMSWASGRQTTRLEDMAYCLLGIFEVNMPLIYGEGIKAFRRLQEEIIKHRNDLTIFAWEATPPPPPAEAEASVEARVSLASGDFRLANKETTRFRSDISWLGALPVEPVEVQHCDLFAPEPASFARSGDIDRYGRSALNPDFSITNKGLRIEIQLYMTADGNHRPRYFLPLGRRTGAAQRCELGIIVDLVGPNLLVRNGYSLKARLSLGGGKRMLTQVYYILLYPNDVGWRSWVRGVYLPHAPTAAVSAIPQAHFDVARRMLLIPLDPGLVSIATVPIQLKGLEVRLGVVLTMGGGNELAVRIFDENNQSLPDWVFRRPHRLEGVRLSDLKNGDKLLLPPGNILKMATDDNEYVAVASVKPIQTSHMQESPKWKGAKYMLDIDVQEISP